MWQYLLGALALVLMFEGVFPLIAPEKWRETIGKLMRLDNRTLRTIAFIIFTIGAVLWFIVQHTI